MILNYFDCRGRAQPIRNYLHERGIAFVDNKISVNDGFQQWSVAAKDPALSGEFGMLPTLDLGDGTLVSEALVIALQLEKSMSLHEQMLVSSTYQDVIINLGMLIWADVAFPGCDFPSTAKGTYDRMMLRFRAYENSLKKLGNAEPFTLAHHFLGEGLDAAIYTFGPRFEGFLADFPNLSEFYSRYRRKFSMHPRPSQFTARPMEADVVKRIHQVI